MSKSAEPKAKVEAVADAPKAQAEEAVVEVEAEEVTTVEPEAEEVAAEETEASKAETENSEVAPEVKEETEEEDKKE